LVDAASTTSTGLPIFNIANATVIQSSGPLVPTLNPVTTPVLTVIIGLSSSNARP